MEIDFQHWAVVSPKDDTGFGRMADGLKKVLGVGWHFVTKSDALENKPVELPGERLLPPTASDDELRGLLRLVEGIVFFERPGWHRSLLRLCREEGRRAVCCPNWEWFRGEDQSWRDCDLFVCTSRYAERVVRGFGFTNTAYVGPWMLDLGAFPERRISGPARHFIHNAGVVDPQDRKATRDTIRAFQRVRRDDLRLTVRLQKEAPLPPPDPRITVKIGNPPDPADLYRDGDVAIQPSKMEGIGFMVIEPLACGIPTLTLDYPPMNEYVTDPRMLVRKRWFKRRAFPTAWVKHAHLRLPSIRDLARRIEWCAEHPLEEISAANRAWGRRQFEREHVRAVWQREIEGLAAR